MKKALKVTMGAAIAASSLTPVAALAADVTPTPTDAKTGFYNIKTGEFVGKADFKALEKAEKAALITNPDVYVVVAGTVYQASDLVKTSAALGEGTPEVTFETAEGVELTDQGQVIRDGVVLNPNDPTPVLTVESVKAINPTTIQVTFNGDVTEEQANRANFSLSKGEVEAVSVQDKIATLTVKELTYGDAVKVTVVDPAHSAEVTIPEVSEVYALEITTDAPSDTIKSDGAAKTQITVTLKDRVTGEVVEEDGIVQFQATRGGLGQTTSALQNGKATVQLTSVASATSQTSIVTATISDVPGAAEFEGLTNQKAVIFSPEAEETGEVSFVNAISAESTQGDRLHVTFSDKVSAADYKAAIKKDVAPASLTAVDYGIQINKKDVTVKDVVNLTDNTLEFILDVDSSRTAVNRIENSTLWTGSVVGDSNYLRDNVTHNVSFPDNVGSVVLANATGVNFILTDTSRPAVLGVTAKDQLEFNVRFTEAIDHRTGEDENNFLLDGREVELITGTVTAAAIAAAKAANRIILTELSVGEYDFDKDGKFDADNRNIVTFKVHKDFALAGGEHQIQVANVGDWASDVDPTQNFVATDTFDFNVTVDGSVPAPKIVVQSAEQWKVSFDKPVYGTTGKTIKDVFSLKSADSDDTFEIGDDYIVSWIDEKGEAGAELSPTDLASTLDGKQHFLIEFTEDWTVKYKTQTNPTKTYFSSLKNPYVVTLDNVESAIGNKMDKKELDVKLSYDGQSPEIAEAEQVKVKDVLTANVRVTMTEPVKNVVVNNEGLTPSQDQGTEVPTPTYEFVKGDKVVKASVVPTTASYDNYAFTLAPEDTLEAGEWTLYIRSISDDIGNTSATVSEKVTIAPLAEQAETDTQLAWAAFDDATGTGKLLNGSTHIGKDVVYVKFTKEMKSGGANGVSRTQNYVFMGQPLPAGSQVLKGIAGVTNDWDGVTIVMPENTWNGATANDFTTTLNIASNFESAGGESLSGAYEVELSDTATTSGSLGAGVEALYASTKTQNTFGGAAAVIGAKAKDINSDGKIATIELKLDKENTAIEADTEILVNGKKFVYVSTTSNVALFKAPTGQELEGTASNDLKVTGLDGSIIINTGLVADEAAPVIIDSALNDDRSKLTITFSEAIDKDTLAGATYDLKTFKLNAAGDGFDDDLVDLTGALDDFDPSKPNQLVLTLTTPNGNTISDTDVLDAINIADLIGNLDGDSLQNVPGDKGTFAGIKNAADAEQVKVSLLAGAIADQSYSNNGNAAGLPTVPAGYTVKVLTSGDTDVYGIPNGTLGDAGTSTGVTYEITHTASGKKGTSSPVTVTVTDAWQDAADAAAAGVGNQNFSTDTTAANTPIYPNLPTGYTAEVESSSNVGTYALDGTLGSPGTSQVVYKITDANGRTSLTAPVTVTVAGDNIFEFELLPSIGAADLDGTSNSTKFGNYDVLVLAAGPTAPHPVPVSEQNKNITGGGTTYNYSPDGAFDFKLTQNAGGLDTSNFMVLHNDQDGTYKIHINENGASMNGDYVVDVTGKGISSYASFKQQFVYGTVGNDVTYAITAQDSDLTTAGLSAADVTVKWSTMKQANVTSSEVFILPTGTALGASHTALNGNTALNGAVNEFVGTTGSDDSAGNALVAGTYDVYVQNIGASGVLETLKVEIYLAAEAGAPAPDTTAPVITANDETVAIADLATTWTETVSATDDVDGNITGNVVATYFEADGLTALTDLTAAKAYIDDATTNTIFVIKYNVSDVAGNAANEVAVMITVTP